MVVRSNCLVCGKEIVDKKLRKYCSRACDSIAKKGTHIGKYSEKRVDAVVEGKYQAKLERFRQKFEELDNDEAFQKTLKYDFLDEERQWTKLFDLTLSQLRTYFKARGYSLSKRDFPECFTKTNGYSFEWYRNLVIQSESYWIFKTNFLEAHEQYNLPQRACLKENLKLFCSLEGIDFEKFLYDKRTLPEELIRSYLRKGNYEFEEQKMFKRENEFDSQGHPKFWRPDFYVNGKVIEVNGDFWHAFGIPFDKMSDHQKEVFLKDQQKYLWYKKHNIQYFIIWEHEVLNDKFDKLQEFLDEVIN